MKNTSNKAINTTELLKSEAVSLGIQAEIIQHAQPETRRYSSLGSTHAPQKVITLNGIRMSLGQAKQYIKARS